MWGVRAGCGTLQHAYRGQKGTLWSLFCLGVSSRAGARELRLLLLLFSLLSLLSGPQLCYLELSSHFHWFSSLCKTIPLADVITCFSLSGSLGLILTASCPTPPPVHAPVIAIHLEIEQQIQSTPSPVISLSLDFYPVATSFKFTPSVLLWKSKRTKMGARPQPWPFLFACWPSRCLW